jgi:hypothetical protein
VYLRNNGLNKNKIYFFKCIKDMGINGKILLNYLKVEAITQQKIDFIQQFAEV